MSNSIVPAVLTSAIVGLVAFKLYDDNKNTQRTENFVDYNLRSVRQNYIDYDTAKEYNPQNDIFVVSEVERRRPNNKLIMEDLPLPENENVPPPFYEVDRVYNKNIISRQQKHADPIRGDLPIIPLSRKDCNWFVPRDANVDSLHSGALSSISSCPNHVENLKSQLKTGAPMSDNTSGAL